MAGQSALLCRAIRDLKGANLSYFRSTLAIAGAITAIHAPAAFAGEQVLYGDSPDWVDVAPVESLDHTSDASHILYDLQHRLEDGIVVSYQDAAQRIKNPQSLAELGTITLTWYPDKGDLTVHAVEILRGNASIDVLAGGAEFDVLRREQGLEQRLLDGMLTATLSVPGLQVGDVLRVAHSRTLSDQALGQNVQLAQYLPRKPWEAEMSRVIVSWPAQADIAYDAEIALDEPELRDGYQWLEVALPLDKAEEMPSDAPARFRRATVLRAGSFASWEALSRAFAPHYEEAASISADGEVAEEAAGIMRIADDPRRRAALALRLVQDEVGYLLNGLNGGNYMPQSAEETWQNRFGDCKAKSVLLLALLREMGIEAETVLVSSNQGDTVPELLPLPASFDHMIVRARIDGKDYWLDGTSAGGRLANLGNVPPFYHALPLTAEGSALVPMVQREPEQPNMAMKMEASYPAGLDLPLLYSVDVEIYGAEGAAMRRVIDAGNDEFKKQIGRTFSEGALDGGTVSRVELSYDDELGMALIEVHGISPTDFSWQNGKLVSVADSNSDEITFNPNRARKEWREIPVLTPGSVKNVFQSTLELPTERDALQIEGDLALSDGFGNLTVTREGTNSAGRFSINATVTQLLGEVSVADIAQAKRDAQRINNAELRLEAPSSTLWRWERKPKELAKLIRPIVDELDRAVEYSEEDDTAALLVRGQFYADVFDWEKALADFDAAAEISPTAYIHLWRGYVLEEQGRLDDAIAARQEAYDLDPEPDTAFYIAELLGYAERNAEAVALLDSLVVGEDEETRLASSRATVVALAGDLDAGLAVVDGMVARRPEDGWALNNACWHRALFDIAVDTPEALDLCTKAVERSSNTANALDSRAMLHYRRGDYESAMQDLEAALAIAPALSDSRYLKGIIGLELGRERAQEDIEQAVRLSPSVKRRYDHHGIEADN